MQKLIKDLVTLAFWLVVVFMLLPAMVGFWAGMEWCFLRLGWKVAQLAF